MNDLADAQACGACGARHRTSDGPDEHAATQERRCLAASWGAAWPHALAAWGPSVRMSPPRFVVDGPAVAGMFAWFDLADVRVNIDLREVARLGLQDCAVAVLAHEIGHHIMAPADLATTARLTERCRRGLVDHDHRAAEMANLWNDLLINDRLARLSGLDMAAPYRSGSSTPPAYFAVFLRTCELLWQLPRGELTQVSADQDTDAALLARHARVFARDPVAGAGGFAALMRKHLADNIVGGCRVLVPPGAQPPGLAADDALTAPVLHPALDPRVNPEAAAAEPDAVAAAPSTGQTYGPSELETTYAALGIVRDAAADWYLTRARKHLVPFPVRVQPAAPEPQWEGLETWDVGDDIGDVEWLDSAQRAVPIIPGYTTVRRIVGDVAADETERAPVDLDLYVDSSGSMVDPRRFVAPAILAGTILLLSALRVGARARVSSWASPGQVYSTNEFTRDTAELLDALLHFYGGGTSFPLDVLAAAQPVRPTHIAVISDDGVASMFGAGQPEHHAHTAHRCLRAAAGGGSLLLAVPDAVAQRARSYAGDYDVYGVQNADIVNFARQFARRHWSRA